MNIPVLSVVAEPVSLPSRSNRSTTATFGRPLAAAAPPSCGPPYVRTDPVTVPVWVPEAAPDAAAPAGPVVPAEPLDGLAHPVIVASTPSTTSAAVAGRFALAGRREPAGSKVAMPLGRFA